MKNVNLNYLDGEDFERLSQQLLNTMYNDVQITALSNDKGRDLVIRDKSEIIFVECKHWSSNSVGRPVIQKLHSAIITGKAKKGIIMTTSRLSQPAKDYIRDEVNDCEIEIIEFQDLKKLGANNGYNIFWEEEEVIIDKVSSANDFDIKGALKDELNKRIKVYPNSIDDYLLIKERKTSYINCYRVHYSVNTTYKTQAVCHRINKRGYVYFDSNGKPLSEKLLKFLKDADGEEVSENIHDLSFKEKRLRSKTTNMAINKHSEHIKYTGGNNVTYRKKVVPKKKDITICGIEQIKYPRDNFNLNISNQVIEIDGHFNNKYNRLIKTPIELKSYYSNIPLNKGVICSDCGKITAKTRTGESYICNKCKKTICYDDSYYYTAFKLFNRFVCSDCSKEMNNNIDRISHKVNYQKNLGSFTAYFWILLIFGFTIVGYFVTNQFL
ncbi:restriction endonuclease [Orenia metallireducens]|uniref:Restriction endonuclease n=1 Tax=Orenia metallireducens TaxID=1413210 RepID=A0A285IFJ7_9FIRM|nr:restriction endonuclease [Orenia metallireducens]PRX18493.1 restriction endonuclease [Orenia metallireducens]SNY46713.1 Restriction endonuclease [Orenia metallireducens]